MVTINTILSLRDRCTRAARLARERGEVDTAASLESSANKFVEMLDAKINAPGGCA